MLVLHPALRAEWFKTLIPRSTPPDRRVSVGQEAVERAATLFRHVAETYFEDSAANSALTADPVSLTHANEEASRGFLEELLAFDFNIDASTSLSPRALFDDEIRRYLAFEGGRGTYLDPLGWWKVSVLLFNVNMVTY